MKKEDTDVARLFEGLSRTQAERLRDEILPTLRMLRAEIRGETDYSDYSKPLEDGTRAEVLSTLDEMDQNLNLLASGKRTLKEARAKHYLLSKELYVLVEAFAAGTAIEYELSKSK
jgi:hypothetical protein